MRPMPTSPNSPSNCKSPATTFDLSDSGSPVTGCRPNGAAGSMYTGGYCGGYCPGGGGYCPGGGGYCPGGGGYWPGGGYACCFGGGGNWLPLSLPLNCGSVMAPSMPE